MEIRHYQPADREACLSLFEANQSQFFTDLDPLIFHNLLDNPNIHSMIAEHDGGVIGFTCFQENSIQWLMVHPDLQRQGVGRFLTLYILREMGKAGPAPIVSAQTISHAVPFFEKLGFRTQSADQVFIQMIKKMDVCA